MVPHFRTRPVHLALSSALFVLLIEAWYYCAGDRMSSSEYLGEYNVSTSDIDIDARNHSPENCKRESSVAYIQVQILVTQCSFGMA